VQTYPLTIIDVQRNTADSSTIFFDVPVELQSTFDYEPGQYLTLELEIEGKKVRRSYSFCSSPVSDTNLAVTVKRIEGGLVSNYLNDNAASGQVIKVMPPMGAFVPEMNPDVATHYILFGAGSGITPLMSIIKSVLEVEPKSKVSLLYGNHNEDSIIFLNELSEVERQFEGRFRVRHTLSQASDNWKGDRGRIDGGKVMHYLKDYKKNEERNRYFICGPTGMIQDVENNLLAAYVQQEEISREYFVVPEKETSKEVIAAAGNPDGSATVKVIYDQQEHDIKVTPNESILDAAIDADIDPPFACMAAACATCRAKVLQGSCSMDDREMLSDEEIEQGYILTCQAHPTSADVIISYDQG